MTNPAHRPGKSTRSTLDAKVSDLAFLSNGETHPGLVRVRNEDAFLNRPDIGLWAVADGMGGHDAGEIASQLIMDTLAELSVEGAAYQVGERMAALIQGANSKIQAIAIGRELAAMGSTVVTMFAHGRHFVCLWAGDSRAYLLRAGELTCLTRDHSVLQEVIDTGIIQESKARRIYPSNVITRAVGVASSLNLDSTYGDIEVGDMFLLCSDGVTSVLSDEQIRDLLTKTPIELVGDKIRSACFAAGAPDNLTSVVVQARLSHQ